jgi:hypothetical protein
MPVDSLILLSDDMRLSDREQYDPEHGTWHALAQVIRAGRTADFTRASRRSETGPLLTDGRGPAVTAARHLRRRRLLTAALVLTFVFRLGATYLF